MRTVTAFLAGPPPSTGSEILAWIDAAEGLMMVGNEALVIGAGLLLIGVLGFQRSLQPFSPMASIAGSGLFFATLVVCLVLGIVQGRFVYPIHGLSLTRPDDAELLATLYFGGYHLVALGFAAATTFWATAMLRAPRWVALGYLGFLVAIASVVSSFPDRIGPMLVLILESFQALWWLVLGFRLRAPG